MNRTGYQIFIQVNDYWQEHKPAIIYMNKKEALKKTESLFYPSEIFETTVIDSYDAIADALDSIKTEHPDYQATLSAALEEVQTDIDNPTVIEENEYQNSDGSIKSDKVSDWLHSISICGGD